MNLSHPRKGFLGSESLDVRPATGALYVHVPFCVAKCRYCDFWSVPVEDELADRVIGAMLAQLRHRQDFITRPATSIFVGGGTPTALPAPLLSKLIGELALWADQRTEFTVEANPNSLSDRNLSILREAGVNRLSLGVQSFQADELALLGRLHSPEQAIDAIKRAEVSGFRNISADLIYGIPGQTLASWRDSLRRLIDLPVQHVSAYCLSFEPGTPLADDLEAGRVEAIDDSLQLACYDEAIDRLEAAGFEHYEISNFARPGQKCRHNMVYWHNGSYLGIGPSAVSYLGGWRAANLRRLDAYVQDIENGGEATGPAERLEGRAAMAETLMLGLRLREGIDRAAFAARYGCDPLEAFPLSLGRYRDLGMIETSAQAIRLARKALFVADTILADILAE